MIPGSYFTSHRQSAADLSVLAPLSSPSFTGQVRVGAGVATAPSLAPAGDADTGVFSPAADTLAVSTGGLQRVTVDPAGRLIAGHPVSLSGAFGAAGRVQVVQDGNPAMTFWRFNADSPTSCPYLFMERSRSSTAGQNVLVQNGDSLGQLAFNGADGTTYHRAVMMTVEVDGAPSTGVMPGRLRFLVSPPGSNNPAERMRIASDGSLTMGAAPGGESLRVVPIGGSVNRIEAAGAVAGGAPSLAAAGADANLDLSLMSKGSGRLRFGAYTAASGLTPTGSIEIKDAGGTVRRLLVA